ncbi:MAG TPA: hypothetical protein VHR55_12895 [Candidatus Limnocylindria bacterium]|nr:hypothetical protein [Candidatus Limnocylindria bacterium]
MRNRVIPAAAASFLTWSAVVMLVATTIAAPLDVLGRPMLIGLVVAAAISVASIPLGAFGRYGAVAMTILFLLPALWWLVAALGLVEVAAALAARWRRAERWPIGRASVLLVGLLCVVSAVQLAPRSLDYVGERPPAIADADVPVYLLLVDGYPRIDTLQGLGIENDAFVHALEERGFDHYPDATSLHQWTHRTLDAMAATDPRAVPDEGGSAADREEVRERLGMPENFVVIDPPASHVMMRGGPTISAGGMNDFEAHLIGRSVVTWIAPELARDLVEAGLRRHLEGTLDLVARTPSRQLFAHLLAPHPPFLYADGLSTCWPACGTFEVDAEKLGMSRDAWAAHMDRHLDGVNRRLLDAVDRVLDAHPDAVIVLFGDHGARYGGDRDEPHRTFLAARTPGAPHLFDAEPHPHAILSVLAEFLR